MASIKLTKPSLEEEFEEVLGKVEKFEFKEDAVSLDTATEDKIQDTIHEVSGIEAGDALELVRELVDSIEENSFRLGGILNTINAYGWYSELGYTNFKAYVESETDLSYRKAMYLIGTYQALTESAIPWERVKHLGWTKLKELAPHLTLENIDKILADVEGMTVIQIQEYVKAMLAADANALGGDVEEGPTTVSDAANTLTTMTFKLHADQKVVVREALDKARDAVGTTYDSVALEAIAIDYLSGAPVKKQATKPTIEDLVEVAKNFTVEELIEVISVVYPDVEIES